MDKEQARFILRSFRPDGADCGDADFAEALKLAAEDLELNEWLAAERAFDASFSRALGSVDLPPGLRDDILACLAAGRGDLPQAEDPLDATLIGAVAAIRVPSSLRDETLAAMELTAASVVRPGFPWRRLALPVAAAAGVAFALVLNRPTDTQDSLPPLAAGAEPVPLELVQAGFIRTFESPLFHLDARRDDHRELVEHLRARKLPCMSTLPPGLRNAKGVGCRELIIDGKQGSLLCFDEQENGTVHLVIFRSEDVRCGGLPRCGSPRFVRDGNWSVARWTADGNVFVLLGNTEVDRLKSIF
jgi:hypothetical protein